VEEAEEFPLELYKAACDAGIVGVGYPEAVGGRAATSRTSSRERRDGDRRPLGRCRRRLGSHGIALPPIIRFGTPEQQARFVRPCLSTGRSRRSR